MELKKNSKSDMKIEVKREKKKLIDTKSEVVDHTRNLRIEGLPRQFKCCPRN